MEYKIVEYDQNVIGRYISKIMPLGLKPHMREGDPIVLKKTRNKQEAINLLNMRKQQLVMSGHIDEVAIDIEELHS